MSVCRYETRVDCYGPGTHGIAACGEGCVGAGKKTYTVTLEDPGNPEKCLLKAIRAAADGNIAAIRSLEFDMSGARKQAEAGQAVPGLRFTEGTASPSVRGRGCRELDRDGEID